MPHDIFISYSRRDLAAVKPIKEELERLGFSCWMDLEGIESGSPEFTEAIAEAIGGSTSVLFFLSTASQASRWSLNELRVARDEGKHVVLVRFNEDRMVAKFKLEFGGTDVIDWRIPEQKGKLLRDLSSWAAGPKPSDRSGDNRATTPPGVLSVRPSEAVKSRLKKLSPSKQECASGFQTIDFGDDVILASDRLDDALRNRTADEMRMVALPEGNPFSDALRKPDPIVERTLAWKRDQRGDLFRNEAKIGLASDLLLGSDGALPSSLSVFWTDYFSSFRTNEMATLDVDVATEGVFADEWRGDEHFPWLVNPDGTYSMRPFSLPGFSNHLGGNTLGVTDDGMLVLWIQSPLAERSQNRWAPTGSGSLDWSDLDSGGSFLRTVENGATRELREECCIKKDDSIRVETRILGYYRWCGRGGLPGFLCASRIGCPASRLSPETKEVGISKTRPLIGLRSARTREDLERTVNALLDESVDLRHMLSTPLRANLLALRRALVSNAAALDFLFN